jgi:hypothetical protein
VRIQDERMWLLLWGACRRAHTIRGRIHTTKTLSGGAFVIHSTFIARRAGRRTRATVIGGAAALAATAALAAPAGAAVTNGVAVEVFHDRDFVNIVGYDPDTPLQVVVRDSDGRPVGFADVVTDEDGNYELNHAGPAEGGPNDCFQGETTPDIIPGDTVEVMVNGDPAKVDTTVVQNVQYPDPAYAVDPVAHTITVTGFAKTPAGAPLDNVEIRLNHPKPGVWDARGANGRKDWRAQGVIDAAGSFTAVFKGASDADLTAVASADVSAQWNNANLTELTAYDGLQPTANEGCPPLARRPIAVPPPVVVNPAPAVPAPPIPAAPDVSAPTLAGPPAIAAGTVTARQEIKGVTETALRVSRLSLARHVSVSRLRLRGLQAGMRLDPATQVLRLSVYRARAGRRSGRALLITNRLPPTGGVYRVALRNRGLVQRLRPGLYVIEARAGRSAATLGPVSRVVFRVTR